MRIKEILSKLSLKKGPASFAAATLASTREYDLDIRINQFYLLREIEGLSTGCYVDNPEFTSSDKISDKTKELVTKLKILFKQIKIERGEIYAEKFLSFYYKKLKDYIDSNITSTNNVHHPLHDEFVKYVKLWFEQGLEREFVRLPDLLSPLEEPKPDCLNNQNSGITAGKMIDFHIGDDFVEDFLAYLILYQIRRQALSFDRARNNVFGLLIEEYKNLDQDRCDGILGTSTLNELKMLMEVIRQDHYKENLDTNISDLKRIFSVLLWTLRNCTDKQDGRGCPENILYQVGKSCLDLQDFDFALDFKYRLACSKYGFPVEKVFFVNKDLADGYEDLVHIYEQYPFEYVVEIITQITFARFSAIDLRLQLEQFIYEEYHYGIAVTEFSPAVQSEIDKYSDLIAAIPNREDSVDIDDANGPQQTLNRLTVPITLCNGRVGSIVRASVFLRLLEKYNQYELSDWSYSAIDSDALKVRTTILNYEALRRLYSGEGGKDSYSGYKGLNDLVSRAKDLIGLQVKLESVTNALRKITDNFGKLKSDFECLKSDNERLEDENRRLLKDRSEISELSELALEENSKLVAQGREITTLNEDLASQVMELQALSDELKLSLLNKEKGSAGPQKYLSNTYNEPPEKACFANSFISDVIKARNFYPVDCLSLIANLADGKVIILPEALESAKELGQNFTQTGRLLSLLLTLIYQYTPLYFEKGDTAARKVFTAKEYAAKDSETTQNSKEKSIRSVRSVKYLGRNFEMRQHLKIGVANNLAFCLRVYFFMDPDMKCPVIGYCGSHPAK